MSREMTSAAPAIGALLVPALPKPGGPSIFNRATMIGRAAGPRYTTRINANLPRIRTALTAAVAPDWTSSGFDSPKRTQASDRRPFRPQPRLGGEGLEPPLDRLAGQGRIADCALV